MALLDYIFPRICHICGTSLSPHERYICSPCLAHLPRTLYHRRKGNDMEMRFAGKFPFEKAASLLFYSSDSAVATLMHDLKYRNYRKLAQYMGEILGNELLSSGFFSDIDLIIPVPMHFLKKAKRGYNQTQEIASGLSKVVTIPVDRSLIAAKPHSSQTGKSREERLGNLKNVFKLKSADTIKNKHILLLDDVCTTGTTLSSAAEKILDESPSTRISLLTLGVTF